MLVLVAMHIVLRGVSRWVGAVFLLVGWCFTSRTRTALSCFAMVSAEDYYGGQQDEGRTGRTGRTMSNRNVQVQVRAEDNDGDDSVSQKIQAILDDVLEWQRDHMTQRQRRPFVFATFAQSLDGKMAVYELSSTDTTGFALTRGSSVNNNTKTSSNYPLSGKESLLLTHALRSIHDGILVGSRTFTVDNPRLTNRFWNSVSFSQQPRPIILDTNLHHIARMIQQQSDQTRGETFCRCLRSNHRRCPILCCSREAAAKVMAMQKLKNSTTTTTENHNHTLVLNISQLHRVQLLPCICNPDGTLCLVDVLRQLKEQHDIQTLMVEGGATLLSSLFAAAEAQDDDNDDNHSLVDAICVTIAPKILGWGPAPTFAGTRTATAQRSIENSRSVVDLNPLNPRFVSLGRDTVLLSRWL